MNKEKLLEKANQLCNNTLMETLGIRFTDIGTDFLTAEMEVNSKVHQPEGLLHGGASAALAETVGGAASILLAPRKQTKSRGIQISVNHVQGISKGKVMATAKAIHTGKSTQIWSIRIIDEKGNLISICQLTTMFLS
ncbi:MAG: hotdog fold thioesterase [Flavobacteriaceae bacterium]|nr:hotdog fold thioesterase [Flavobacteriaceae bacterium]MCY4266733.1 hotdog fold thioesterase [Flavobacteriaceae bacterium]MCY4297747.1 hotdog fold thioesterase [Flavobacteriaceae bacterium]